MAGARRVEHIPQHRFVPGEIQVARALHVIVDQRGDAVLQPLVGLHEGVSRLLDGLPVHAGSARSLGAEETDAAAPRPRIGRGELGDGPARHVQDRHVGQRLQPFVEHVRGVAGQHDERGAHRGGLGHVVRQHGERVVVAPAEDERRPVGHRGVVEHHIIQEILIRVGRHGTVDQPDEALGGQRAHAAQHREERTPHFRSAFLRNHVA